MSSQEQCQHRQHTSDLLIFLLGAIGIVIVLGNSLVIAAICKCRRLHTPTNVMVVGLAVADLLTGLVAVPLKITSDCERVQFYPCILMNSVIYMIANVSILLVLGINLDRLFSVKFPVQYRRDATTQKARRAVLGLSAIGISLEGISIFLWNQRDQYNGWCSFDNVVAPGYLAVFHFPVMFLLPISIIFFSNIFIMKRVRRLSVKHYHSEHKAKRMVVVITLAFVICWLPIHFEHVMWYVYKNRENALFQYIEPVVVSLYFLNSAINPCIYALCNSRIREAIRCLLRCKNINKHGVVESTIHNLMISRRPVDFDGSLSETHYTATPDKYASISRTPSPKYRDTASGTNRPSQVSRGNGSSQVRRGNGSRKGSLVSSLKVIIPFMKTSKDQFIKSPNSNSTTTCDYSQNSFSIGNTSENASPTDLQSHEKYSKTTLGSASPNNGLVSMNTSESSV